MTHDGSTDIAILAGVIAARAIVEYGEPNTRTYSEAFDVLRLASQRAWTIQRTARDEPEAGSS